MDQRFVNQAIFVTGPARSGTSLVAGLLARHGVWTGRCTKRAVPKYPHGFFENDWFLAQTRDKVGTKGPVPGDWPHRWRQRMLQEGYEGGAWLVKAMPWAWKFLQHEMPLVVFCWRPATEIIRSRNNKGWGEDPGPVLRHWDAMRDIRFKARCVDIPTERLVRGDFAATKQAFMKLGIPFDESIAHDHIDPTLWNRKA